RPEGAARPDGTVGTGRRPPPGRSRVTVAPGTVLWTPPPDARRTSAVGRFLTTVEERTGRRFDTYEDAWRWSVESLEEFWAAVWEFGGIAAHRPYETVLERRTMPGA